MDSGCDGWFNLAERGPSRDDWIVSSPGLLKLHEGMGVVERPTFSEIGMDPADGCEKCKDRNLFCFAPKDGPIGCTLPMN